MSVINELAILGILNEAPMHGYQIRFLIERRMKDYANVHFASIYHALGKYEKAGWVVMEGVEKQTSAPERRMYRITPLGKENFLRLLRDQLTKAQSYLDPLGVCLTLLHNLALDEIVTILETRLAQHKQEITQVEREYTRVSQIPQAGGAIELSFRHVRAHLQAEIQWLENTLLELPKNPAWLRAPLWSDLDI